MPSKTAPKPPREAGFIRPIYDFMIKGVFCEFGDLAPLTAFLLALLPWLSKEDIVGITFPDTHRKRKRKDGKESFFDFLVRLKSGLMINIEVQLEPLPGLFNRSQYGNARMMEEQIARGGDYASMPQVITIFIVNHPLFRGVDGYRQEFWIMNPATLERMPNSQGFIFIDLTKVPAEDDGTELWRWARFLLVENSEEMDAIAGKDPAMREAATRVKFMSADESMRIRAFQRDKVMLDLRTLKNEATRSLERGLAEGKAEGKAEGRAEGEAKARLDIARSMLASDMPLEQIAAITGLSARKVKALAMKRKS